MRSIRFRAKGKSQGMQTKFFSAMPSSSNLFHLKILLRSLNGPKKKVICEPSGLCLPRVVEFFSLRSLRSYCGGRFYIARFRFPLLCLARRTFFSSLVCGTGPNTNRQACRQQLFNALVIHHVFPISCPNGTVRCFSPLNQVVEGGPTR